MSWERASPFYSQTENKLKKKKKEQEVECYLSLAFPVAYLLNVTASLDFMWHSGSSGNYSNSSSVMGELTVSVDTNGSSC